MALAADDLIELKNLNQLPLAQITGATRIAVQKGDEPLKWITISDLITFLSGYFQVRP